MWVQSKLYDNDLNSGRYKVPKLLKFAQDESFNHDFKNCSEISAVTWFIIYPKLLHFPTFMLFTPPYCPGEDVFLVDGFFPLRKTYGLLRWTSALYILIPFQAYLPFLVLVIFQLQILLRVYG